ncbi:MAG: hypothetical protein GF328_13440 [Candidatus Latescibacteria bacterium]|nr:hypothetical protein [Candidatus Latescibacterota bacterium]
MQAYNPFASRSFRIVVWIPVALALLAGCAADPPVERGAREGLPPDAPEEILSWRHRILPREDYARLAEEWEQFAIDHPRSVRALVEWGDALRYSGRSEEAKSAYARAFRLDSTHAAAIAAHVANVLIHEFDAADWDLAHDRLVRAVDADPSYAETYYPLWSVALQRGDDDLAARSLRSMVEVGDMPRPLFDCGYNMIAGSPRDAIILTNGDNDTYPPLAVQAVLGTRPDVAIVNLSLLNTKVYLRHLRDRGIPFGWSEEEIERLEHGPAGRIGEQAQRRLHERLEAEGWPRSLFYSVTVPAGNRALPARGKLEGLLHRIAPIPDSAPAPEEGECDLDRTRLLFDAFYRIDSMTDPLIDWERESGVARLGMNYAALLAKVGNGLLDQDPAEPGGRYLHRAVSILAFHGNRAAAREVLEEWERRDPDSPLLARSRSLLDS